MSVVNAELHPCRLVMDELGRPVVRPAGRRTIRRGVRTSVKALEHDITAWIDTWNQNPRPFTWTKNAEEILNSLAGYLTKISRPRTDT